MTFLFISHHLQEIYEICDTVTVFRDARHIVTAPVAELPRAELVAAMTGEAARPGRARHAPAPPGPARRRALERARPVAGDAYAGRVASRCGAGEIVGLAGAGGSGTDRGRRDRRRAARAPAPARSRSPAGGPGRAACPPRSPPASASSRRTGTTRASCRGCRSPRTSR